MTSSAAPEVRVGESSRTLAIGPAAVLVPVGLFVAVVATAAPNGGYFPSGARLMRAGRLLVVCNVGYEGHYETDESFASLSVYERDDASGALTSVAG